jgi:hypothetical protein
MEEPETRRRWAAVVTVAAFGALFVGVCFVVSSATRSRSLAATATTVVHLRHTSRAVSSTIGAGKALSVPHTAQSVVDPAPPSAGTAVSIATSTWAPATTGVPVAVTPTSAAPVPAPTLPPLPASLLTPMVRSSHTLVSGPGLPENAQAAVALIGAINQGESSAGVIPVTPNNVALLERWIANEGGVWAQNPLNTSRDSASYPHQFTTNGQDTGIPIFPNLALGVAATAATLWSNSAYARILRVLRSGVASCPTFARAVIQSPWASGHYGHDPAGFCSGRIVPARRGHRHHRPT